MAVIRHRAASGSYVPTYLLYSSHYYKEISYREELERLATEDRSLEVFYTLTRCRPEEDQYVQQPSSNAARVIRSPSLPRPYPAWWAERGNRY